MRERHQRPVSDEAETNDVISRVSDETVLMLRVGLCNTIGVTALTNH
jgi:hypothetical protein